MTNSEFRAWFEGFTEAFDTAPTKKQWERIKARVKEIDGNAVTQRVFVDRYWGPYYPQYQYWQHGVLGGVGVSTVGLAHNLTTSNSQAMGANRQSSAMNTISQGAYDSLGAMQALGRADAAN